MVILENIDIDIDIDKAILQNIDIDKISNRFKFGISNRATVTSPSCRPLLLAKAAAICLTCVTAPTWRPPSVSMVKGKKTRPSCRQASAVSLSFLWQVLSKAAPALAAAADTLEAASGPVRVTSMAASFPLAQRRIMTSPGLAEVPGSRCLSSLVGPRSALAAA